MIVSQRPVHLTRPLVITMAALVVWDVGVTLLYENETTHFDGIDIQFTLFGTAIALFLGFMVNAAYSRWWEARTLWGAIVNSSRSLARQAMVLVDSSNGTGDGYGPMIVRGQIAYVHTLRTALRGQPLPVEASQNLSSEAMDRVRASSNAAATILVIVDEYISAAAREGRIGEFARLQMEATLVALTDAQGGLERIRNTPLPVQYRFLPRFFARVFCLILPFAVVNDLGWWTPVGSGLVGMMFLLAVQIGDDLANPFLDSVYDVPMTAICATIERDLTGMIGANVPDAVQPVGSVLW